MRLEDVKLKLPSKVKNLHFIVYSRLWKCRKVPVNFAPKFFNPFYYFEIYFGDFFFVLKILALTFPYPAVLMQYQL